MSGLNRDDVIRMVTEVSGVSCSVTEGVKIGMSFDHLERFAALVVAAEREECAALADKLIEEEWFDIGNEIRARGQS